MASSLTASQVGSQFVEQYYDVLQHQPEFTNQFYTGSSTMIRVDGESTETASALSGDKNPVYQQIHKLVQSLQCSGIKIKNTNSVETSSEGVMVVVCGSVKSDCFTSWREFVQTFFLAPNWKKNDYLVMIDIFHFVSPEDLSGGVYMKDPIDIHYIKREDSESVEDFLFRFTKETSQIPGADEKMKISGFIHGVRDDELVLKLYENIPQTVKGMIDRVKGFVRGKKACALNAFSLYDLTKSVPIKDLNRYCEYHQDVGHYTDDCVLLKRQIEEAVQTGDLAHLVEEIKNCKGDSSDANQELYDDHPKRKKIRMLYCIDTQKVGDVKVAADSVESWLDEPIISPVIPTNDSIEGT